MNQIANLGLRPIATPPPPQAPALANQPGATVQGAENPKGGFFQWIRNLFSSTSPTTPNAQVLDAARLHAQQPAIDPHTQATMTRLGAALPKGADVLAQAQTIVSAIRSSNAQLSDEMAVADMALMNFEMASILIEDNVPLSGAESEMLQHDLSDMKSTLLNNKERLAETSGLPEAVKGGLMAALDQQMSAIDARVSYLQSTVTREPLTQETIAGYLQMQYTAIANMLSEKADNAMSEGNHWAGEDLKRLADDTANGRDTGIKKFMSELKGDLAKQAKTLKSDQAKGLVLEGLKKEFKALGLDTKTLKQDLKNAINDQLNNTGRFQPIQTQIQVSTQGGVKHFDNAITPANALGNIFDYHYNPGQGVASSSTSETRHAVNLARTELKNSEGKTLFAGIRHGIHSAFTLKSGQERTLANQARALEMAQAALVSNPGLLAKALAGEEVDLNMTSLSLVTPDDIRGLTSGSKSEKAQWRDQKDAYQAIKGPQSFQVLNEHGQMTEVKVNVKPIALNFGVNQGAVAQGGMGSVMRAGAVGAWSNVMDSNRRGLESMLGGLQAGAALGGLVGDYLSRTDVTDKDKSIVRTLADQVKTIWNDESYKKEGNEAHKMTSRIAVLTHMTGNTIAFNCKSGKDRTGVLDVEAKFLAARIDMHGTVPEINARLNVEEQEMYRNFSFNSGNLEMQQYNTGLGGYKNQLLGSTTARLGDDEAAKTFHKGGSKAVGS